MIEVKKNFMQDDLISIIIPIYNVQKYLERCVESVLGQTYHNLEIILVDDGSTDNSCAICDKYKSMDKRVMVVHKKNGGLSDARNAGIEIANGRYLFFLDSDDYLASRAIEVLHRRIVDEDAEIAICNFSWINAEGQKFCREDIIRDEILSTDDLLGKLVSDNNFYYVVAWNKLYARKLFDQLRFMYGKIHEDEYIVHRIFGECRKAVSVSDILYYYIKTDNSITTSNTSIKRLDYIEALDDRIDFFKDNSYINYAEKTMKLLWWVFSELYISVDITDENEEKMKKFRTYFNKYFRQFILLYSRSFGTIMELIIFRVDPQWYKRLKKRKNEWLS